MNQTLRILLVSAATLCAASLRAQQQASTLFALAKSADAVCVATAVAQSDPSPEWRRVDFRVDERLKGAPRAAFSVLEPAGRCCGAALLGAEPGRQFVMFLQSRGGAMHPIAGDRGVVAATPDVVAHVRETLATLGDGGRETQLLARSLAHSEARVAQDAALALAAHPQAVHDALGRQAVADALDRCTAAPTTALPALATTLARAEGDGAARALLPRYLATTDEQAAAGLRRALEALPASDLAAAVRAEPIADENACIRAAGLLEERPDVAQLDVLQRLLRDARTPRAQAYVASALLENGVPAATLARQVHKSVLAAAVKRRGQRAAQSLPFAAPPR